MSGDDVGADILVDERRRRNRQVDQPVQGVDLALDAPAVGQVDDGKRGHVHDVAGDDHVRRPEQREAVGIAVGRRLVQHLDALVVHAQGFARREERL